MIGSGSFKMPFVLMLLTSTRRGRSTVKSGPFKVRGYVSFLGYASQNLVMVVSVYSVFFLLHIVCHLVSLLPLQ